ncbi:MAG: tRNA-dihydrouridine synthase [Chthoniobacter sp.]
MIGRAAIRNPWIFQQIRQHRRGEPLFQPTGRDVLGYIHALYEAVCDPEVRELSQVQKMKKYLNFISQGVEPTGQFQHSHPSGDDEGRFLPHLRRVSRPRGPRAARAVAHGAGRE